MKKDDGEKLGTGKAPELKVFISTKEAKCDECGQDLGRKAWITLVGNGSRCLSCAELDHLEFLMAGDAALTRRSRKYSPLVAVVLKWSRARKRYERQGLLVTREALDKAEQECLADEEARARRRGREAVRRELLDQEYVKRFAARVGEIYPSCPPNTAVGIAEHACLKYSGRVGRSADAKALDVDAVRLAVVAHVRHVHTRYDRLLAEGYERLDARDEVERDVDQKLREWS
uniref:DUF2293 domain-containing protein n=1 Tax=Candidatus Kentrum sp. FW TaxID=2126338 RepID=A0A450SFL5_9GAMM|nr:MAG: hypothetical protein BECKFW1821A_GA0114235_10185 [Candidatus Kentron sp. FW]VFJ51680.1 MAG: hypothetical protein BECKFW1821B_GA0114236_10103 [Candidatus Kentron sp. FW]